MAHLKSKCSINILLITGFNCGHLVLEATALPTEPQPPNIVLHSLQPFTKKCNCVIVAVAVAAPRQQLLNLQF